MVLQTYKLYRCTCFPMAKQIFLSLANSSIAKNHVLCNILILKSNLQIYHVHKMKSLYIELLGCYNYMSVGPCKKSIIEICWFNYCAKFYVTRNVIGVKLYKYCDSYMRSWSIYACGLLRWINLNLSTNSLNSYVGVFYWKLEVIVFQIVNVVNWIWKVDLVCVFVHQIVLNLNPSYIEV